MKIRKCQNCGKDSEISKMYVKLLENPEPYMVNGQVMERVLEILCQECAELKNQSLVKVRLTLKREGIKKENQE
jgi:hypothetical protein|tara:strand:- start:57 stop:278 length:222 start_codon:yes stop_codon:yes gene_type:complete